ncbi:hypothetical protein D3C80_1801090 [compost metagenome]
MLAVVDLRSQVRNRDDALGFCLCLPHGECIGVVRLRGLQPGEPLSGVQPFDPLIGLLSIQLLLDLVVDDQRGPGVLPVDVHLSVFLSGSQHRRA